MGFIGTQSKIILYQTKAEKHYVKNRKTIFSSIQNMSQKLINLKGNNLLTEKKLLFSRRKFLSFEKENSNCL